MKDQQSVIGDEIRNYSIPHANSDPFKSLFNLPKTTSSVHPHHSPSIQSQQLSAKGRKFRHSIFCLLPFPGITRKCISLRSPSFLPGRNTPLAQDFIIFLRRHHRYILRHPYFIPAGICPDAMRLRAVEYQKITRLHRHFHDLEPGDVRLEMIPVFRLR